MNKDLMELIQKLSEADKEILVKQALGMISNSLGASGKRQKNEFGELAKNVNGERPACPHCGTAPVDGNIVRKGYKENGAQRFYCKGCGKYFVSSTGTTFAHTHKSFHVWRQFIELTITGATLHVCAERCGIAYQTAFTWRHKVLNVFRVAQENIVMTGYVEADELLIPLSYKGNHIKGRFTEKRVKAAGVDTCMPREAYKRGSDNKVKSSKERACVFCMVENANMTFYASVPGVGFMHEAGLDATVGKCVDRSSALVLVDQYKVTRNYLDKNGYNSIVLAANTSDNVHDHKPEIQGANREIHMQHVNSMHTHLRRFMADYCGVSSKYLSNYVSLYVWLKNNNALRCPGDAVDITEQRAAYVDCYVSQKELQARPMVPTHACAA